LEISEETPPFISSLIAACWDHNPKFRPAFGTLAKQFESDIVCLQISSPPSTMTFKNYGSNTEEEPVESFQANFGTVLFFESQPANNPDLSQNIILNTVLQSEQVEKKPYPNFQSLYTRKKLFILAGVAFILTILAVGISLLIIFLVPSQEKSLGLPELLPTITESISPAKPSTSTASATTPTISFQKSIATIVSTLAGSGVESSADGFGASAGFSYVGGITFRASDNVILVADFLNGIREINGSGHVSTLVKSTNLNSIDGDLSTARFKDSYGITVDNNGNIYVVDHTGVVRNISNGLVQTMAGTAGSTTVADGQGVNAQFTYINGITSDGTGYLYTVEIGGRIRKIDANNNVATLAGSSGEGNQIGPGDVARFSSPEAILYDDAAKVFYISDYDNRVIKKMDLFGNVTLLAGCEALLDGNPTSWDIYSPNGLALDGKGNLIFSEYQGNSIRRLNLTSLEVTTIAGTGGIGANNGNGKEATFNHPTAITIDQDGSILVADSDNFLIRKISFVEVQVAATVSAPKAMVTKVSTYAGTGDAGFVDGPGFYALFGAINDITIRTSDNTVYVTDYGSGIRAIDR
jgi:sugar lactone lactonase YvrE